MQKISGKEISGEIISALKARPVPGKILAAVLVGGDPVSISFLKQKEDAARELGVDYRSYEFPGDSASDSLRREVGRIASQKSVGGILVQLPLPERVNKHYVANAIPREKDVDVLGERALGAFYNNRNPVIPPAVGTIEEVLSRQKLTLNELIVAVVGLGTLVGKPISVWLSGQCKELRLLSKGSDFNALKEADLIITGVGEAGIIEPRMLKQGAGVIDFGYYYFEDQKLAGDLKTDEEVEKLSFYTPTPGGTGPILVAKLMENFYKLNGSLP